MSPFIEATLTLPEQYMYLSELKSIIKVGKGTVKIHEAIRRNMGDSRAMHCLKLEISG